MKKIITVLMCFGVSFFAYGQSSEVVGTTVPEKKKTFNATVVEKSHDVKRATKKGVHKVKEMTCKKDDPKCQAMKEKHRAQEQAEFHNDKLSEAQDAVYDVKNESTP